MKFINLIYITKTVEIYTKKKSFPVGLVDPKIDPCLIPLFSNIHDDLAFIAHFAYHFMLELLNILNEWTYILIFVCNLLDLL